MSHSVKSVNFNYLLSWVCLIVVFLVGWVTPLLPTQRKHRHKLIFKSLFSKVLTGINAVTVLVGNISHDLAAATC